MNQLDELRLILQEIERRENNKFVLDKYCFKQQIEFISDPSRFKTAVCSRRAGKTISCAVHLLHHAKTLKDRVCLYITLDRRNAKRIIWRDITKINQEFNLGFKVDNQELSLTHPITKSVIYISGAKDSSEIEKFRGLAVSLVYIDESQAFRPYIEDLVDDILGAALYDYNGTLCLIGTPGPIPAGYFYKASHSEKWSHHKWTMFDNPHLERKSGRKVMELVEEDMARMGVDINHPKIRRENFGEWVIDTESLVLKYNEKNHFDVIPEGNNWNYIIGVDIGWHDSDAIVVIGWRKYSRKSYLVKEIVKPKQGVTELAQQLNALYEEYNPMRIVMDTGGLGKKIAEEITKRYSIPITAAEKTRKFEYLELLNDAMRIESFYAKKDSVFAQDCNLVEWDMEARAKGVLKISENYHSDVIDATLYAYRELMHWIEGDAPPKYERGSLADLERQEKDHFEQILKQNMKKSDDFESDLI